MEIQKNKSFGMGVVGAIVGSLLGAACIILLAQAGVISAISGFVMAFCTLKGFELLGGKLEKKSLIVCIAIMVVMPYLADRVAWAWAFYDAFNAENPTLGFTFGDCFAYVHEFIAESDAISGTNEATAAYIKDLLFVYAFTALGGYTIVKQAFKQQNAVIEEAPVEDVVEDTAEEDVVVETAAPTEE